MFTNTELKDFIQKHETEILKNDWESVYNDFPKYDYVSKLTDFLLNKVHINPLYYMTSVPSYFAYNLDIPSITISNNVTSIGSAAFENCSKLTSITIPNSVRSIGRWAFYACIGLTSITISNGVTEIGYHAFAGCTSLTSITIPSSVTTIDGSAFSNCSSLTSITIPNSVTEIGSYAFYNCIRLTSITIPNSVTSIEESAFSSCSKLNEIKYTGTQQQWDKLLSTNGDFAEWIRESRVKVNLL